MVDHAPPVVIEAAGADSAQFVTREFQTEAGPRRYKLYIPAGYDGSSRLPLVVVLHGCTQDPDNVARGTRFNQAAEASKVLVAYPEQPAAANGLKCWNWFDAAHQKRDQGEPALIAGITRQVMKDMKVDSHRVYVVGLSAGAAMALTVSYAYPEMFAAAGLHSGIAYGIATNTGEAIRRMGIGADDPADFAGVVARAMRANKAIPTIVFQGKSDKTVNPANADHIVTQLKSGVARSALKTVLESSGVTPQGFHFTKRVFGKPSVIEAWSVDELGHAWSGGSKDGTYTDERGPDATREIMRFLLEHKRA
ncbi:MAG TPA: PHB depolymerase family esterase [Gemmatimonadaceae bacterium]|nr:PHB depolymerase family esterase [Gemmatimonadaceae bacterium]